jgi:hypothetical protein
MKVEWTLLTVCVCKSRCGAQTIVIYTHVVPWYGSMQHRHFDGHVAIGPAVPFSLVTTD